MRSADMPDVAGQQAQQMAQGLGQVGQGLGKVAMNMQQQANELRVNDALNKAKEEALRLAFDKDAGYTNLRGVNALERPDGKPLADEYSEVLQKQLGTLSDGLGNEAQRAAFQANASNILTNFRGDIVRHESKEFETYALSVSEGVQSTALREIGLNWNNPENIDKAVNRIKAETYRQAQLLGKSAEWQEARAREMTSKAHLTALGAALDNNDVLYADGYLKKYGAQMEGDDLLRVRGVITKETDMRVGNQIGQETFARASSRIAPSDYARLENIVTGAGVKFDNPEQLDGLLKEYSGDVVKTLAATKLGSKEVDKLVKAHGANWLANAPKSTQEFVTATANDFGSGGGRPPKPTLAEMKAELRQRPELAGNPLRLKHAEDALEMQYAAMDAAMKQREEDNLDAAYKALYANGGNMAALPAGVRAGIPGTKLNGVLEFARSLSKKGDVKTDPEAWAAVMSLPKAALAEMTPSEAYRRYRGQLDDQHLEKLYAKIAEAQNTASDKHLEIITTDNRVKQAAIMADILPAEGKPNKDQTKQFAQFQQTIDTRVRQYERNDLQGKRKATSEELQKIIDTVMLDKAFVPRATWFDKQRPVALMDPTDQARAYVEVNGEEITLASVPVQQRALISAKLQARGLPVTEQAVAELWVRAGKPK
jgi:soluble lytic murein transglycosylase